MIQTRVRPESADAFAVWQEETSAIVAGFPGFIKQTVMPPSPPVQVDWVILQRFASTATAVAWLNSEQRLNRVKDAAPMLVGRDDTNIIGDGAPGVLPSPASAVISTRIKPGHGERVSSVGATYYGQSDLAAMTGIGRESACRIINDWQRRQIISRSSGYYCIENKDQLQHEAELSAY